MSQNFFFILLFFLHCGLYLDERSNLLLYFFFINAKKEIFSWDFYLHRQGYLMLYETTKEQISVDVRDIYINFVENFSMNIETCLIMKRMIPMCFITIELRHSYGVTAMALWPVIAKNCDAVTHNYDKKIVVTRSYDTKIVTMRKYVSFSSFSVPAQMQI